MNFVSRMITAPINDLAHFICPRAFPDTGTSGLVVEDIGAIDVSRARFLADAFFALALEMRLPTF